MAEQAPRASNSGIVAALTARLNELRPAVEELAALTREVQELSIKAPKAEKVASDQAARNDTVAPELVPEREHLNATYDRRASVFAKCTKIWDHATKSILSLAMTHDRGNIIVAQFQHLPGLADADAFQEYVRFLEIIVETNSPATIVEPSDDAQIRRAHAGETARRLRGRPIEIPEERKAAALMLLKTNKTRARNREAAKLLYDANNPSKTQRDSVYSIVGAYCRKHGLPWPLHKPAE